MGYAAPLATLIESRDGVASIALSGDLDLATVPVLNQHLTGFERSGVSAIMLDLRDVTFIDSTGLHAFLQARDRANANGHRLILIGASTLTRHLFELSGTQFLLDEQETAGEVQQSAPPARLPDRSWMSRRSARVGTNGAVGEEAALMDAFLERDPEAADRLYRRVSPAIYRLGSMLLRDEAKAESLVETTMVHAWRLGASFDPHVISLDAWVRSIARDIVVAVLSEVSPDRVPSDASDVLRGAIVSEAPTGPEHGRTALLATAQ